MHVNAHEADNDLQFLSYNQVTKLGYVQRLHRPEVLLVALISKSAS